MLGVLSVLEIQSAERQGQTDLISDDVILTGGQGSFNPNGEVDDGRTARSDVSNVLGVIRQGIGVGDVVIIELIKAIDGRVACNIGLTGAVHIASSLSRLRIELGICFGISGSDRHTQASVGNNVGGGSGLLGNRAPFSEEDMHARQGTGIQGER